MGKITNIYIQSLYDRKLTAKKEIEIIELSVKNSIEKQRGAIELIDKEILTVILNEIETQLGIKNKFIKAQQDRSNASGQFKTYSYIYGKRTLRLKIYDTTVLSIDAYIGVKNISSLKFDIYGKGENFGLEAEQRLNRFINLIKKNKFKCLARNCGVRQTGKIYNRFFELVDCPVCKGTGEIK